MNTTIQTKRMTAILHNTNGSLDYQMGFKNKEPVLAKDVNPMDAVRTVLNSVALEMITDLINDGLMDMEQAELLAIEYQIPKSTLNRLFDRAANAA